MYKGDAGMGGSDNRKTSSQTTPPSNGLREGVARCMSQACVYGLEARKTLLQVYGRVPKTSVSILCNQWIPGMLTSSLTAGCVFGTYFSVYNQLSPAWYAGTVSAVATSFVKIPISNGMRVMQAGAARNLVGACRRIVKLQSWRGLYTGYGVSLMEDIIEFDMRTRMYNHMTGVMRKNHWNDTLFRGVGLGALSGSIVAGITTPFDTIRAHMAVDAAKSDKTCHPMKIARHIVKTRGWTGLYKGMPMRVTANALKSAIYFTIFELIPDMP